MSDFDPPEDNYHSPEPQVPYTPSPEAARILAIGIQTGYIPLPLPQGIPPEWVYAIMAVEDVAKTNRLTRWQAFIEAASTFDYRMVQDVNQATEASVDRTQKDRILYETKDCMHDPPVLDWVVPGVFARPSLNILVGDPGAKKTYLAIDLAACVANGKPWLHFPVKQCPVFLVDEETGYLQLWARLHATFHAHDSSWGAPFNYTSLAGYDLRDSEDADQLFRRVLSREAGLIIIDSFQSLLRGSENNPNSIQSVLFNLRRMAETCKAAVVVIHHNNREGAYRGSSSISASVDLMLSVSSAPTDTLIELRPVKARFLAPEPFCARANFETTTDGKPRFHLTATDEKPETTESRIESIAAPKSGLTLSILEFLSSNPHSTREQLTSTLNGYSEGSVRNALHQLMISGQITRNPGNKGKKAIYELSD